MITSSCCFIFLNNLILRFDWFVVFRTFVKTNYCSSITFIEQGIKMSALKFDNKKVWWHHQFLLLTDQDKCYINQQGEKALLEKEKKSIGMKDGTQRLGRVGWKSLNSCIWWSSTFLSKEVENNSFGTIQLLMSLSPRIGGCPTLDVHNKSFPRGNCWHIL